LNNARFSRGTLIASGFIAGGALFGVFNAFLLFLGQFMVERFQLDWGIANWASLGFANGPFGEILGLIMFALLFTYMMWDSMRGKEND
jgi:hypothetical protein